MKSLLDLEIRKCQLGSMSDQLFFKVPSNHVQIEREDKLHLHGMKIMKYRNSNLENFLEVSDLLFVGIVLSNHTQLKSEVTLQSYGDLRLKIMVISTFVHFLDDSLTSCLWKKNLATIHLKNGIINNNPEESFDLKLWKFQIW